MAQTTQSLVPLLLDWLKVPVGALIAIAASIVAIKYQETLRRKREERNLASAFAGEVSALLTIVEKRQYVQLIEEIAERIQKAGELLVVDIPIKQRYFNVFESNVGNVGTLDSPLPEKIVTFYTQAFAILDDLEVLRDLRTSGQVTALTPKELATRHFELAQMFRGTIQLGREILQLIGQQADT